MKSTVSLVVCPNYSPQNVQKSVYDALTRIGGLNHLIKHGDKVLLKPNFLIPAAPERATTTHPEVIRAVAHAVRDCGARLFIGDSPAVHKLEKVIAKSGVDSVCKEMDISLVPFENKIDADFPEGRVLKTFPVTPVLKEYDIIVNIPKLKTHFFTYFTGGIKNMFGCVPGAEKPKLHLRIQDQKLFSHAMLDVYSFVRPAITIMDGVLAMEGKGPTNGTPRKADVILASRDALAVDSVAVQVVGQDPFSIPTIKFGHERGIGNALDIDVVGNSVSEVLIKDFKFSKAGLDFMSFYLPHSMDQWIRESLNLWPRIESHKCLRCQSCLKVCPAGAIRMTSHKKMVVIREKCIHCFCCREVCPHEADAISIQSGWLRRLLGGFWERI